MKCPKCGNETEANTKFCTTCGFPLESAPVPELKAEPIAEQPHVAPQQVPQQNPQPAPYFNTAAKPVQTKPAEQGKKKRDMAPCKPLSTWAFVWRSFIFAIPVIGLIVLFVMAFAKNINENSRSFARSCLIYLLIGVIILVICGVLCYIFREPVLTWLGNAIRTFINE